VLSFSVLGVRYALARIVTSFLLVMVTAHLLDLLVARRAGKVDAALAGGCDRGCAGERRDLLLETGAIFRRLLPYLIVAGAFGVAIEHLGPRTTALAQGSLGGVVGILAMILIGTPLYFCNGAEVLFLRPLINHGFPLGTAVAFSLTSTAVCTASIAMLLKLLGVRLTVLLVACLLTLSLAAALVLNRVA
jgi:uncharacterized membrane protein YraQ (UPF0718 family)